MIGRPGPSFTDMPPPADHQSEPRPDSILVQLSDLHLRCGEQGSGPAHRLQRVLDAVAELEPRPDALLVSGDLVDAPSEEAYDEALRMLRGSGLPVHAICGNHDDRDMLRARFGPGPAPEGSPVNLAVDCGALRLIGLDTILPGSDAGALARGQLQWLEETLAAGAGRPTLLALHHPPVDCGVRVMDAIGLAHEDRAALEVLLKRHPEVMSLTCGHVHTAMLATFAARPVLICPSTNSAVRLDLRPLEGLAFAVAERPVGFAVHALLGGRLVSHIQAVS